MREVLARGATSEVLEWGAGRVLELFNEPYPYAVDLEAERARAAHALGELRENVPFQVAGPCASLDAAARALAIECSRVPRGDATARSARIASGLATHSDEGGPNRVRRTRPAARRERSGWLEAKASLGVCGRRDRVCGL